MSSFQYGEMIFFLVPPLILIAVLVLISIASYLSRLVRHLDYSNQELACIRRLLELKAEKDGLIEPEEASQR